MSARTPVDNAIDDRIPSYRDALFELLSQPSVSTTGDGFETAPDTVANVLARFGLDVECIETDRHPLVYGERSARGADTDSPTILFYGHYDVQPPGDPDDWRTPAFEPTVRNGSVHARGAGDNKGQFLAHALAVDALVRADAFPEVTVKLLIEGGEESGSEGLREYLAGDATHVADADVVFVADGPRHAVATAESEREGRPTIAYGNRGILYFRVEHRTANADLHSGNFGGPMPAATNELVEALASMRDGDEITVDGFYDGAAASDADRELVAAIPDDGAAIAEQLDASHLATDRPFYERLLLEPSLTINGLEGGSQGKSMKTILPHEAAAKLDCRLVPGQDPDAVFEAIQNHLLSVNPDLEVIKESTFAPMKTPVDDPAAKAVRQALTATWGSELVELPVLGGSLPAASFRNVDALADVPVFVVPYANHNQSNHSPDEHLTLECFENGIRTSAAFIQAISE